MTNVSAVHPKGINCNWILWKRCESLNKQLRSVRLNMALIDQGWGNTKGEVDMKLCRGQPDVNPQDVDEWNNSGSGMGKQVVYREKVLCAAHDVQTANLVFDVNHPFVQNFNVGD